MEGDSNANALIAMNAPIMRMVYSIRLFLKKVKRVHQSSLVKDNHGAVDANAPI